MLRTTLERAVAAGLVESRQRGRGEVRWAATDSSAADAALDREWAKTAIARFEREVEQRLPELLDDEIDPGRIPRLTVALIGGLIAGSAGVFDGVAEVGHSALTSIRYSKPQADSHIAGRVHPERVANAVSALAASALDPGDPFGSEIVRLIMAGQVLHGLLTHRDLGERQLLQGSFLLLDTSALLYLLDEQETQSKVLVDLVKEATEAGCDVCVTRSVLREWDRVWENADVGHSALSVTRSSTPPMAGRLIDNVVVRAWYVADEDGTGPSWDEFNRRHRDVRRWLTRTGVRVVEDADADATLVEAYRVELERLTAEALSRARENSQRARRLRTHAGAETDAYSAALVHKQRELNQTAMPTAWFIAQERLTSTAYSNIRPQDDYPLVMSVEGALLLVSATRVEDPAKRRELAEIVGDSVILNSFFAVSTGYALDDIVAMVELLGESDQDDDPEAITHAVRADYLALASATPDPPAELLRRRALRRDRQVRRRAEDQAANEVTIGQHIRGLESRATAAENETAAVTRTNLRLKRALLLCVVLVVIAAALVIVGVLGAPTIVIVVGILLAVAVLAEGIGWCLEEHVTTTLFIAGVLATAAWTLAGSVIGLIVDHPKTTQHPLPPAPAKPSPTQTPHG